VDDNLNNDAELNDRVKQFVPAYLPLWEKLIQKNDCGFFVSENSQYLHLSGVCLRDLADSIQVAGRSLSMAMYERLRRSSEMSWAIFHSRYFFDYAAVALCAASNHLASAMWHLEERENRPLGPRYKTANMARREWKSRSHTPSSLSMLESLLSDEAWNEITAYRDQWVHRGFPIIAGEVRLGRRQIWQDSAEEPPKAPWIMKVETEKGRVCYLVQHDEPQYDMQLLLTTGAAAFSSAVSKKVL
jgi:hypothetical protein